jgi:hypothetical protein
MSIAMILGIKVQVRYKMMDGIIVLEILHISEIIEYMVTLDL